MIRISAAVLALALSNFDVRSSNVDAPTGRQASAELTRDLNAILASSTFARTLTAVRVESLRTGEVLYSANADKLVVPASNLKLLTLAVAADRLGWDYKFETTLEAAGSVSNGTLTGDLIVTGTGDPSLISGDRGHAPAFLEWADALRAAGIVRVNGRLIGDDNAFDDEALGAGWAWDYLGEAYAAAYGALNYNENIAVLEIEPARTPGAPAIVIARPPGNGLTIDNQVKTGALGERTPIGVMRLQGHSKLTVTGTIPIGATVVLRGASIENPTRFFVEALRLALEERGITIRDGAWDIDDVPTGVQAGVQTGVQTSVPTGVQTGVRTSVGTNVGTVERRLIARRESLPLSALAGQLLKVSINFYGEVLLKAIGRSSGQQGSTASGRDVARGVLNDWGVSPDSYVLYDGSGLSRYSYASADALVGVLRRVWHDERLRAPFLAALPVGGIDGTLQNKLKDPSLARRVQAKTGNLTNMRALSGYIETDAGEKLAFSIIVNNHTAPGTEVDAAFESILMRIVRR